MGTEEEEEGSTKKVFIESTSGDLVQHSVFSVKAGMGPRHMAFHPNGRFLYVIGELDCMVQSYHWDADQAVATLLATCSALPDNYPGVRGIDTTCADLHHHPTENFLFGSNRGHDSIAIIRTDPNSGGITLQQTVPALVKIPRNFALSPDAQFMVIAG